MQPISHIAILTNLENDQIFEIVQFEKLTNFQNLTISKTKKKFYHLGNQYSTKLENWVF